MFQISILELNPDCPKKLHFFILKNLPKCIRNLKPFEREKKVAKQFGAVFIIGIGGKCQTAKFMMAVHPIMMTGPHHRLNGYKGLNGDIILWNDVLKELLKFLLWEYVSMAMLC
jgi:aspartate--ammonia ligase